MGPRTRNLSGVSCHPGPSGPRDGPCSSPRTLMTVGVSDNPAQASLPRPLPNRT
jgi:hypothetical protein